MDLLVGYLINGRSANWRGCSAWNNDLHIEL